MTKQELEQKIEQLQKQLDELKNVKVEETKTKWKPKIEEEFYYINEIIEVVNDCNDNFNIDKKHIEIGNCFKTKEEAQFVADKIKYTLMFKHYVEEHSEPIDWENAKQEKWCICYNYVANDIQFDCDFKHKSQGTVYASSEQILKDAIEYVGEDNVIKYVLGVEE